MILTPSFVSCRIIACTARSARTSSQTIRAVSSVVLAAPRRVAKRASAAFSRALRMASSAAVRARAASWPVMMATMTRRIAVMTFAGL